MSQCTYGGQRTAFRLGSCLPPRSGRVSFASGQLTGRFSFHLPPPRRTAGITDAQQHPAFGIGSRNQAWLGRVAQQALCLLSHLAGRSFFLSTEKT